MAHPTTIPSVLPNTILTSDITNQSAFEHYYDEIITYVSLYVCKPHIGHNLVLIKIRIYQHS